jgi:hypothetical protein
MLPSVVAFLAIEAAATVAADFVLPAFARRIQRATWPGRVALFGVAAVVATAAATRPVAARRVAQSVALSQLPRVAAALGARTSAHCPAAP